MYKLSFFVPKNYLEAVKKAVFAAGAGKIGNYDYCSWQAKGEGQFRPLAGSKPFLGKEGKVEKVKEYLVEMVCADEFIKNAVNALKEAHPYEEPAYYVIKLEEI